MDPDDVLLELHRLHQLLACTEAVLADEGARKEIRASCEALRQARNLIIEAEKRGAILHLTERENSEWQQN